MFCVVDRTSVIVKNVELAREQFLIREKINLKSESCNHNNKNSSPKINFGFGGIKVKKIER